MPSQGRDASPLAVSCCHHNDCHHHGSSRSGVDLTSDPTSLGASPPLALLDVAGASLPWRCEARSSACVRERSNLRTFS